MDHIFSTFKYLNIFLFCFPEILIFTVFFHNFVLKKCYYLI